MTVGDSPTRIVRIALRDIGPFRDVLLELPPGNDPTRADVYLLTGQNGTGKSTILYALAAAIQCGHPGLGGEGHSIARRFRTPTAAIAIDTGRFRRVVAYFDYDFQRDELRPNPGASVDDQRRAQMTIDLLGLNDGRQPASRRRAREAMARLDYDLRDASYRYLIPLCSPLLLGALPRSK